MTVRPGAVFVFLALGALLPAAAAAQLRADAYVTPFGSLRLTAEGLHASYDARFGADGAHIPLGSGLSGELTPARFAAIRPLATQLEGFLGTPGDSVSFGVLDASLTENLTEGRLRLAVGIAPRLELGVGLGITRNDRLFTRLGLAAGNVGPNPDPAGNAALLDSIGFAELGGSGFLPTADSPLGVELQARAAELTGGQLVLPTAAATLGDLQTILVTQYGVGPLESGVESWRPGSVQLDGRALLASTFGSAPAPPDSGRVDFRVAGLASLRLPTFEEEDSLVLTAPATTTNYRSLNVGLAADLFVGSRFWLTGEVRKSWNGSVELLRRVAPPGAPLSTLDPPSLVTFTPGDVLQMRVAPRYRLAEAIALGGQYAVLEIGDSSFGAEELDLTGGQLHLLAAEVRYSSLPAYHRRSARLPAEIILLYEYALRGPEGFPTGGRMSISASVQPRLW